MRLAARTRFFAAAAWTNRVLAEVSSHWACRLYLSKTTVRDLCSLGARLEQVNIRGAHGISAGSVFCDGPDDAFITMEQSCVECVLQSWENSTRRDRLIAELDRLLRWISCGTVIPASSTMLRRYAHVLRQSAHAAGRALSFAAYEDRVRIGHALVLDVRKSLGREPCVKNDWP